MTLILAALAAGESAGALDALKDDAKEKAKAAYAKLHGLLKKRVSGNQAAAVALVKYEGNPKVWAAPLADELAELGAGDDADLVAAAKALMELIDQPGAKSGKYHVTIRDSNGVQVGDGNFQFNKF